MPQNEQSVAMAATNYTGKLYVHGHHLTERVGISYAAGPPDYIGMIASRPMSENCSGILLAAYHSASAGACCAASCRRLPVGD